MRSKLQSYRAIYRAYGWRNLLATISLDVWPFFRGDKIRLRKMRVRGIVLKGVSNVLVQGNTIDDTDPSLPVLTVSMDYPPMAQWGITIESEGRKPNKRVTDG